VQNIFLGISCNCSCFAHS